MSDHSYPEKDDAARVPAFEEAELTRSEYIAALVHFYRGELHRATMWRVRLDTTTNWSIISVMGLVTFSLGDPNHSHIGILAGMILVLTFLTIEARRFRFFDVWRARTRMLEENFMGPILRRDLQSPVKGWGKLVAADLLHPSFKMTWYQAMRARLLRNYVPLFGILLVCWVLKLNAPIPNEKLDGNMFLEHMRIGQFPWWVALSFVAVLYSYLGGILLFAKGASAPEDEYWGSDHVDLVPESDI